MKINIGTIIRTLLIVLVIGNRVLEAFGVQLVDWNDGMISSLLSMATEVAVIIAAWWKNNSFTDTALQADVYMKKIKECKNE